MKTVPLSASVLAVLVAATIGALTPVQPAYAQSQTDAKIRLMSEALRARDAGDLTGAQQALNRLAALSPNDPAVQKLRSEIEAQAVAQQNALAQRAAAEAAAAAAARAAPAEPVTEERAPAAPFGTPQPSTSPTSAPPMIDVRIPEPGQTPPSAAPGVASTADQEADAIARAESGRIARLIDSAKTQLATARAQLRDGQADDAIATVDAALATL